MNDWGRGPATSHSRGLSLAPTPTAARGEFVFDLSKPCTVLLSALVSTRVRLSVSSASCPPRPAAGNGSFCRHANEVLTMATSLSQNPTTDDCISACQRCHQICLQMAMSHCLNEGGKHVEPEHFRLMTNCAEICQTAANFMLSQSPLHAVVCAACADVCTACADSCEQVGDMDDCVRACRECAQRCEAMGSMSRTQSSSTQSQPARQ